MSGFAARLRALLLALALLASGCGAPAPQREAVEATIREYNRLLVQAFAEQDMNALAPVATRDQAYTEYYQMAALGEKGVRLVGTARRIVVRSVEFPDDDSAVALVDEEWDYLHVSTDTSETVRTERGVRYRLRYELQRQDGRWLVDVVKDLEEAGASTTSSTP